VGHIVILVPEGDLLRLHVGSGQPGEPALCQLYRRTFVPCTLESVRYFSVDISFPRTFSVPFLDTMDILPLRPYAARCVFRRLLGLCRHTYLQKKQLNLCCPNGIKVTCEPQKPLAIFGKHFVVCSNNFFVSLL